MEKNLIPAPIDEKNVTTDWIEAIFDNESCVYGKKCALGLIRDEPVIAEWTQNSLVWTFVRDAFDIRAFDTLTERLKIYDDANKELVETHKRLSKTLLQRFWWKDE